MDMMVVTLNKKISEMKVLRQREERRNNKVAQDALDREFKQLTNQIHQLMTALKYTKDNMQFQLSESLLTDLKSLLTAHRDAVRSGFVEKEAVSKVKKDLESVRQSIKKEWSKRYSVLTSSTINMLKVISGINSEHVSKCLERIDKGKNWTTSIDDFELMNQSLADANDLIAGLDLDQQIIDFLLRMRNGKATVADLDEKVLKWLKTESLDKRVRLSFAGSSKKY